MILFMFIILLALLFPAIAWLALGFWLMWRIFKWAVLGR